MKITQVSVFLENRKGRLYELTALLDKQGINIRALTIAESDDFGVLRILVDKPKEAIDILKSNGFVASFTDIVALEVEDHHGGLAAALKVLNDADINVEYMYGFVEPNKKALLIMRFDDTDKAIQALQKHGIEVVK